MTRLTTLFAALGAALLLATIGLVATRDPGQYASLDFDGAVHYAEWAAAMALAYVAAIWLARNRPAPRVALPIILAAGLAARLVMLATPPIQSNDAYRYVWDGRVQAAGINPYRYFPVDPALAALRDNATGPSAIFPNINRADIARTIYPPAAQLLFALTGITWSSIWSMKTTMLLLDLATTALAWRMLRDANRPGAQIVIWAWNPVVILELSGAGHIDALAATFIALAMLMAIRSQRGWAGLALGLAIITKFLPAAIAPALWRPRAGHRWNWPTPLVAAATIAVGYALYASAGAHVLGYLGGYAEEENLDSGSGFLPLRLIALLTPLPPWAAPAYAAAALALLAALALWIIRDPLPPDRPTRATVIGRSALILSGALIAVLSPHYPWYLTMLVIPAVLCPAWSALWPTLAAPLLYLDFAGSRIVMPCLVFLPALPLLAYDVLSRQCPAHHPALLAEGGPDA